MNIKLVLFLLLIAVVTCYAQKPCCYPDEFVIAADSTVGFTHHGTGVLLNENSEIAFDYTNKRVGEISNLTLPDDTSISYQRIYDFDEGAEYEIDAAKKECKKEPLKGPMEHCVKANATFYGSAYLGDHKMTVDTFISFINERGVVGQVTEDVTQGDCLPNSIVFTGDVRRTSVLSLTGYFNYVSEITDPSKFFTVPDYCTKSFSKEPKKFDVRPYKIWS